MFPKNFQQLLLYKTELCQACETTLHWLIPLSMRPFPTPMRRTAVAIDHGGLIKRSQRFLESVSTWPQLLLCRTFCRWMREREIAIENCEKRVRQRERESKAPRNRFSFYSHKASPNIYGACNKNNVAYATAQRGDLCECEKGSKF